MKLLVVDDDVELCALLDELFTQQDFAVEFESDGARGVDRALAGDTDLVILDVMLPRMDGFEVLRRLRESSDIPVLMLTARGERGERVHGLRLGADDYLAKPFDPEELLARVRAILRRSGASRDTAPKALQIGDLRLLPGTRQAYFRGRSLGLTAMECEILERLMRAGGRVVSRDELSLQLYNRLATPYDRTVDAHVSRIRRKLADGREMIMSVRGTGYQVRYPPH